MYMKKEKGFTLAEILIVLTIIGVMAVMTIPSLIQNSNSQQKIVQFKKAFNAVSNAYATEFAIKSAPKNGSDDEKEKLWDALNNQLNVKYYVNLDSGDKKYTKEDAKNILPVNNRLIVTEDRIGYRLTNDGNNLTNCLSKLKINSGKYTDQFSTCMQIAVFLDGAYEFSKNKYCHHDIYGGDVQSLNNLKCNTLKFPVANDGITAGNPDCTISGRIISDNIEYDATKCQ